MELRGGPPEAGPILTPDQVADLLDAVSEASEWLVASAERDRGSRAAVGQATVDRPVKLGEHLRPGADTRAQLAALDPTLLLAGVQVWAARIRARGQEPAQWLRGRST